MLLIFYLFSYCCYLPCLKKTGLVFFLVFSTSFFLPIVCFFVRRWTYSDTDDITVRGYFGWYGEGGYVVHFSTNMTENLELLQTLQVCTCSSVIFFCCLYFLFFTFFNVVLQDDGFIDIYTRAVFVDFTVYNPMLELFVSVNTLFEMPGPSLSALCSLFFLFLSTMSFYLPQTFYLSLTPGVFSRNIQWVAPSSLSRICTQASCLSTCTVWTGSFSHWNSFYAYL